MSNLKKRNCSACGTPLVFDEFMPLPPMPVFCNSRCGPKRARETRLGCVVDRTPTAMLIERASNGPVCHAKIIGRKCLWSYCGECCLLCEPRHCGSIGEFPYEMCEDPPFAFCDHRFDEVRSAEACEAPLGLAAPSRLRRAPQLGWWLRGECREVFGDWRAWEVPE
jgi:hypothetical protein